MAGLLAALLGLGLVGWLVVRSVDPTTRRNVARIGIVALLLAALGVVCAIATRGP